ncbi:hypothetical protein CONCODRAFT_11726 [Conidiobolus coronatus NRRL 28638]|uniref:Uncharacterized protein n=1 Tax=Conidiobolus coronatus (strain ATCC 28846 / CBS 209.66 / NRRL 28638) TaxID=796925 RepID=A0A137NUE7_CONC2|nr:hypothetical protein CONCODRAFT_11726 [Conidiobolus coronatus NRRL 28638]|eukprot:KXN66435.1 hypothetical protein CONCODRAFT_11726 [Conidiobolus coronatus NRRL 28638]
MVYCYTTICIYRRNQSRSNQLDLGLDPAKVKREINIVIVKSLAIMATNLFTSGVYMGILAFTWFKPNAITNVTDMVQVLFIQPSMIINTLILLNMKPELWKGLKKLYGLRSE